MVDWGRVLAGAAGGGAKGALDYDAGVKQDAREARRDEAIEKRQMALAKYTTGAAAARQTEQIASSEKIAGESLIARTATADADRMSRETTAAAGRKAQIDENIRKEGLKPSGWTAEDGTIIPQGVFDKATPDQKKRWKSPAAQKLKAAKVAAAAKKLEFQRDIILKKIEAGESLIAGPKDVQKTITDMRGAYLFKGDETLEEEKNMAKEYMLTIGWKFPKSETVTPPPGNTVTAKTVAEGVAKRLADAEAVKGETTKETTSQTPGALDIVHSYETAPGNQALIDQYRKAPGAAGTGSVARKVGGVFEGIKNIDRSGIKTPNYLAP